MTKGEFRSHTPQPEPDPQSEGSRNTEHTSRHIEPHVTEETDQLRTAMIWGPVGAEMYLASLYPRKTSLFLDDRLDVEIARDETHGLKQALEEQGVEVYSARDILAQLHQEDIAQNGYRVPVSADYIYDALVQKARIIEEITGTSSGNNHSIILADLFQRDIARYGEVATPLMYQLALNPEVSAPEKYRPAGMLPLGNTVFACDQMKVVGNKRIQSRMRRPIRMGEIELYEQIYDHLGVKDPVEIPPTEYFEGGDLYIHNGTVFIGVGARTSFGGALAIAQQLRDELDTHGLSIAAVVDKDPFNKSDKEQMDMMHLDTWSQSLDPETVILYPQEAQEREVVEFAYDKEGHVIVKPTEQNYAEYLTEQGTEVLGLSEEAQAKFAFNNLSPNRDTVLVANADNPQLLEVLANKNKEAIPLNIGQLMGAYGAAHCMTAQLVREK